MPLFVRPIPIGSVISFRYISPTARDRTPMVLVIASNYQGKIHGLNLRYMRAVDTLQLQWIFKTPQQQQMSANPFSQESYSDAKQREEVEQRRQEFIEKQQGVIVKPQEGNAFGVSTFGPTRKQVQQTQGQNVDLPEKPTQIPEQELQRQREIRELSNKIRRNKQILSNPYQFYHMYIKPLIGPNSYQIAKVYRTYKQTYVQNLRIVHSSNLMAMR